MPEEFNVYNYPNPFNPFTRIYLAVPVNSFITLKIYNTLGQLVKEFMNNQFIEAGNYYTEFDGSELPMGVYFCLFDASSKSNNKFIKTIKLVLLR
jgi:hypothetical protein